MKTALKKYKRFAISLQQLKSVLGEDLYSVADVTPEKVSAADVVYAMKQYLAKAVPLPELAAWVNVIWFTELYEYDSKEENAIASVMALCQFFTYVHSGIPWNVVAQANDSSLRIYFSGCRDAGTFYRWHLAHDCCDSSQ